MTPTADFVVIGAGIAGASIAYWLAPRGRVVLLERESQPGYHSTGRSAALFLESYGPPQVRALTMASRAFVEHPPEGFADVPILGARGAMTVASADLLPLLDQHWEVLRALSPRARRIDVAEARALVPVLRTEVVAGAVLEPDAADIDVHALHQGYLRGVKRHGGRIVTDAEVGALERRDGAWHVRTRDGTEWHAPVVVNAAGAWCDVIARLAAVRPIGLVPKRRSAFVFAPPAGVDASNWPTFVSADETWYVKPEASGTLIGSPANVDPVDPQDVQPEELDIAIAIDRIQTWTTLEIRRPSRTWAGLRSFVADGDLVGGFDPDVDGFFWVAAQGGYGIQTSAAMGEACAALAAGEALPERIARFGVTAAMLSPARLRAALSSGA